MIQAAVNTISMEIPSKYHVSSERMAEELGVIEASKKDPARFELLYNRYYEQIFRYAFQRISDKDLCYDVTQQVFVKAMSNLHKYEHRGLPFSSWLYRIAQSEVYQALRDRQSERTVNVDETSLADMVEEFEDSKMFREMQYEKVAEALMDLEEDELQLVEMRFMEKRAFKEIGEILDITENNAKVRLYRVLEKLRRKLTK